jgi:hypothetical protein
MFLKLKSDLAPETPVIKTLYLTRWTVRAQSLRSFIINYDAIQSTLETIVEEYRGKTDVTAPARGILATM